MIKLDKKFFEEIGKPTVVMLAICIIVTLALSATNMLTKDKIASLSQKQQNDSMQKLLPAESYTEGTLEADGEEITYHTAKDGDVVKGYIFVTSAKGYGGDISVMTALDHNCKVAAVEILDASNETPGLGQNVKNESFYSQYIGRFTSDTTAVKQGTAKADNEINAVTGATISSSAVTNAVNEAVELASANFAPDTKKEGETVEK